MPDVSQLSRALQRLQQDVEREIPGALEDAALELADNAAEAAPKDTGTLAESLTYEFDGDDLVRIGPDEDAANPRGEKPSEYGFLVELDQPYLRPTLDNNAGPAVEKALRNHLKTVGE